MMSKIIFEEENYKRSYMNTYKPLINAIKNNDKDFLKNRVRYNQKFTKEIFETYTGNKLPNSNVAIAKYFDKNYAKGGKTQGYNDRLDESLANRDGVEPMMMQSFKDRRDESKGMEKAMGRRAYQSVGTMDKMANGGEINKRFLENQTSSYRDRILQSIADYYGTNTSKVQRELYDKDAEMIYEYIGNNRGLKMRVYEDMQKQSFAKGGEVDLTYFSLPRKDGSVREFKTRKEANAVVRQIQKDFDYPLIVRKFSDSYRIEYAVKDFFDKNAEIKDIKYDYAKGGEVDAFIMSYVKGVPQDDANLRVDTQKLVAKLKKGGKLKQGYNDQLDESLGMRKGNRRRKMQNYKDRRDESKAMERSMGRRAYASVGMMDKGRRRRMAKGGELKGSLRDILIKKFNLEDGRDIDNYQSDLYVLYTPEIKKFLDENLDFPRNMKFFTDNITKRRFIDIPFMAQKSYKKGGKIGFDALAKKVAKRYEGKKVPRKFQKEYGKRYSKEEAMEVGNKVASKVYRQQQK